MDLKIPRELLRERIRENQELVPLLIRFAWHCCGTYDRYKKNGGSNGGTIRFKPEREDPENKGFGQVFEVYEEIQAKLIKDKALEISYADLYILGGYVAFEMARSGKNNQYKLRFKTGRSDLTKAEAELKYVFETGTKCPFGDGAFNPHGSRLPAADLGPDPSFQHHDLPLAKDPMEEREKLIAAYKLKAEKLEQAEDSDEDQATNDLLSISEYDPDVQEKEFLNRELMQKREKKTIDAVRGTFDRLGFSDKETVCLIILGHQFGQCHPEVSGNNGFWFPASPNSWNTASGNGYFSSYKDIGAFEEVITAQGKRQFEYNHYSGKKFMFLVSDLVLYWDDEYWKHLQFYMNNSRIYNVDCRKTWIKLTELGCENLVPEKRW